MSSIGNLGTATVKNIKRIIRSPITLAIMFLGPFIVLLLIQAAYQQDNQAVNLDVGLVFETNNELLTNLKSNLENEYTKISTYQTIDECINKMKWAKEDACLKLGIEDNKPSIELLVDYSELNFVASIIKILQERIAEQSTGFRGEAMNQLNSNIEDSVSDITSLKETVNDLYSNQGPMDKLDSIQDNSPTVDLEETQNNLDNVKSEARDVYEETDESLNNVLYQLNDVEQRTVEQRQTLNYLRTYGQNCDQQYLPNIVEELDSGTDPDQVSNEIEEYGRCKCVEFYGDNIEDIDRDLIVILDYIDEVKNDIYLAQSRNHQFLSTMNSAIDGQESQLEMFAFESEIFQEEMSDFAQSMTATFDSIRNNLNQAEAGTGSLLDLMGDAQDMVKNPIKVAVNPIIPERKLVVYFFPMMYFFILMFISLIFTSTFIYSERTSKAKERNILSPINNMTHTASVFFSMLIVLMVQSSLLLLLANFAFDLSISPIIFGNIMLLTLIVLSAFILVGIAIGYLFNTQLLVMFGSIGILIGSFIYANVVFPVQMLSESARAVVALNPFSIGVNAVSQFVLFNLPLNVISQGAITIGIQSIVLVGLIIILVNWREKTQR